MEAIPGRPVVSDTKPGSSQVHYCQMCQGLIRFLNERVTDEIGSPGVLRRGTYVLGIAGNYSRDKCCLCTLILQVVSREKWLESASASEDNLSEEKERRPSDDSVLRAIEVVIDGFDVDDRFYIRYKNFQAKLQFYTTMPESTFSFSSYEHFITESMDSEECWSLANKWLKQCTSEHNCLVSKNSLPTRLIKINANGNMFYPHLVQTSSESVSIEYCTLSHCWGNGDFLQLLQSNYDRFHQSIPYTALSKTFQDAIYAAHRMGFEYIWIDSLCIIQKNKGDWTREAASMSQVYAGSILNLAAASDTNEGVGLFSQRDPLAVVPCISRSLEFSVHDFLIADDDLWNHEIDESTLSRRAWVVQERYLATRTLFFGSNQLFWECTVGRACENRPWIPIWENFSFPISIKTSRQTDPKDSWNSILGHYTKSLLSFDSDKLVAISGVAKYLSKKGLGPYIAGLWRNNLELQLLWEIEISDCGTLPAEYRAPSWSWAAIDANIYPYEEMKTTHFGGFKMGYGLSIKVLDAYVIPKVSGDFFGDIVYASLRVQCGHLKTLSTFKRNHGGEIRELFDGKETIHAHLDTAEADEAASRDIFLLHILTFECDEIIQKAEPPYPGGLTGLVLTSSGLGEGFFKRIGRFWIDRHPSPRVDLWDDDEDSDGGESGGDEDDEESTDRYMMDVNEADDNEDDDESTEDERFDDDSSAGNQVDDTTEDEDEYMKCQGVTYRSSIWSNLPNAPMHERAAQGDTTGEEVEEQFIITLV